MLFIPRFQENSVFTYGLRPVPGFEGSAYVPGNAFSVCPVCSSKSLRKNISGRFYCGNCKKFIGFEG